jgi:hypothetical protein
VVLVNLEALPAWLNSAIRSMEAMRVRFAAARHPMGLTPRQEIELAVLRSVLGKIYADSGKQRGMLDTTELDKRRNAGAVADS